MSGVRAPHRPLDTRCIRGAANIVLRVMRVADTASKSRRSFGLRRHVRGDCLNTHTHLIRRPLCGRTRRFPDSAPFSRNLRGRLSRFLAVATVLPTGTLESRGSRMAPVKPFSGGCRIRQSATNSHETTGLYPRCSLIAVISRISAGSYPASGVYGTNPPSHLRGNPPYATHRLAKSVTPESIPA